MMDMTDKIFAVDDVPPHDLEDHLNELATDHWVLHSIESVSTAEGTLCGFTVIAYRAHDWEAYFEANKKKWEAELDAEKKAEKYWAAKMAENNGGHANE
jgi:hypothetical protein